VRTGRIGLHIRGEVRLALLEEQRRINSIFAPPKRVPTTVPQGPCWHVRRSQESGSRRVFDKHGIDRRLERVQLDRRPHGLLARRAMHTLIRTSQCSFSSVKTTVGVVLTHTGQKQPASRGGPGSSRHTGPESLPSSASGYSSVNGRRHQEARARATARQEVALGQSGSLLIWKLGRYQFKEALTSPSPHHAAVAASTCRNHPHCEGPIYGQPVSGRVTTEMRYPSVREINCRPSLPSARSHMLHESAVAASTSARRIKRLPIRISTVFPTSSHQFSSRVGTVSL
jgi:hypothetical protein